MAMKGLTRCDGCGRDVLMLIHSCPGITMPKFMSLGDRMKHYENRERLSKDQAVIIRVDGKAFHTWTSKANADKPFDYHIIETMVKATALTAKQMQGFKLAYTQSDEATFCLIADGEKEMGWFDYKTHKLVSLAASYFTYFFNEEYYESVSEEWHPRPCPPAFFDARAYTVPLHDVGNVFVWRQQDWERNSIQMLGQSRFSHKQLQGKSNKEVLDMLESVGVRWDELNRRNKWGTFIHNDDALCKKFTYDEINDLLGLKELNATN